MPKKELNEKPETKKPKTDIKNKLSCGCGCGCTALPLKKK
jgi:hypothetical protein